MLLYTNIFLAKRIKLLEKFPIGMLVALHDANDLKILFKTEEGEVIE